MRLVLKINFIFMAEKGHEQDDQGAWSGTKSGKKTKERIFTAVETSDVDFKGDKKPKTVRLAEGERGYEVRFGE